MPSFMNFFSAIKLIWQNRETLIRIFEILPTTLNFVGEGLEKAGESAVVGSHFIRGGGNAPINARQVVVNAATAIEQGKDQINFVADQLNNAGDEIGNIKVPTISFTTTSTPFGDLISGINIGDASLFSAVRDALKDGADRLNAVGDKLHTTSTNLNNMGNALNTVGNDFNGVGTFLIGSGQKLQEFSGEAV